MQIKLNKKSQEEGGDGGGGGGGGSSREETEFFCHDELCLMITHSFELLVYNKLKNTMPSDTKPKLR